MIEKPRGVNEALRSPTLESLVPRIVPGSILTVHSGRTDYRVRVTEAGVSGPARDMMGIRGTLVDATNKLEAGIDLSFFVPTRTPGESLRITAADGKVLATSAVREYSLEPARETDKPLEAHGLADYQGERWTKRFQTETPDSKRGMRALLAILPEELRLRSNEANSYMGDGVMDGTKSLEEHGRDEAARHAQGEALTQQLKWLEAGHMLLQKMLVGDVITRWDMATHELGWQQEEGRYALRLLAHVLRPDMNRLIGDPAKHFSRIREGDIGNKDPQRYEAEAQRLLGLRDAKGVLKSMEEGLK